MGMFCPRRGRASSSISHQTHSPCVCDSIMGCKSVCDRRRVELAVAGLAALSLMTSLSATGLLCGLTTPFAQHRDIKRCGASWLSGGGDGGAAWSVCRNEAIS